MNMIIFRSKLRYLDILADLSDPSDMLWKLGSICQILCFQDNQMKWAWYWSPSCQSYLILLRLHSMPPHLNGQVRVADLPILSLHVYFLISQRHYKLGWTARILIMRINHKEHLLLFSYFFSYYLPIECNLLLSWFFYQWILIFVMLENLQMSISLSFDRLYIIRWPLNYCRCKP